MELKVPQFPVLRKNQEELHIHGPEGVSDVRTCSSYPSKVLTRPHTHTHTHTHAHTHTHTHTHAHHIHSHTHTHNQKHDVQII